MTPKDNFAQCTAHMLRKFFLLYFQLLKNIRSVVRWWRPLESRDVS